MADSSLSKAIAATALVAVGGVVLITSQIDVTVNICDASGKSCRTLTANEYRETRLSLATKIENGTDLTWEEYRLLLDVLNSEIRKDGLEIDNVRGEVDIKQGLINKLRED